MPGTVREIMVKSKLSRRTVQKWIAIMREAKESHITGWKRTPDKGPHHAIHGLGPGKDARCQFKPLSNKVRWKRHAAKLTDEQWDIRRARDGARRNIKKAKAKPNPWFGALMVPRP
jgi:hypothetical protein